MAEGAKSAAIGIKNSVTSFLGIHSPSRVMHEVGVYTMQGLVNGMASMQGAVSQTATTAVSSVTSATDGLSQLGQVGQSIGQTISSAFKSVIDGSASVGDALKSILSQLGNMLLDSAFQALFGGGGSGTGGGAFGSLFSGIGSLLGFANGGSFGVGGAGGIDSQLVAFRASPNETVSVTKPGQDTGGGSFSPTYQIDARGSQMSEAQFKAILKEHGEQVFKRATGEDGMRRMGETQARYAL